MILCHWPATSESCKCMGPLAFIRQYLNSGDCVEDKSKIFCIVVCFIVFHN